MAFPEKVTLAPEGRVFYYKPNGNNTYDGLNMANAVATTAQAITLANATTPGATDQAVVQSDSANIEATTFTLIDHVYMESPNYEYVHSDAGAIVTMGSDNIVNVQKIENTGAGECIDMAGQISALSAKVIQCAGGKGITFTGASSYGNDVNVDYVVTTGAGTCIENTSSSAVEAPHVIEVSNITFSGNNGIGIHNNAATTPLSGAVQSIRKLAGTETGTTGIKVTQGTVDLTITALDCDNAIDCDGGNTNMFCPDIKGDITVANGAKLDLICGHITGDITVDAGGELTILCVDHDGTLTNNGTIDGNIQGSIYGTWQDAVGLSKTVIVNSESDLPAPSAGVITLDNTKIYQIVGDVVLTNKIDLNGGSMIGSSRSFDKLTSTTTNHEMFINGSSGTLSNLTLTSSGTGAKLFNTTGTGVENLALDTCSLNGSTDLGLISDFAAFQMLNCVCQTNSAGLTCTDISSFSMNGTSFTQTNTATTQLTLTGTFTLIKINGGGFGVPATKTGLDLSGITTLSSFGQIDSGCAFTGAGTFVDDLTVFNDSEWSVEALGLPQVYNDLVSAGDCYISSSSATTISIVNTPVKLAGTTTTGDLFRVDNNGGTSNRLRYIGTQDKEFFVHAVLSADAAGANKDYTFYLYKNGSEITGSGISRSFAGGGDIGAVAVSTIEKLSTNDYVEVWVENNTDTTNITASTMNLIIR